MKNIRHNQLKYLAAPLTLAVGIGVSACAETKTNQVGNNGTLSIVRLIGGSKDGNTSAVNGGEQAIVYNPTTLKNVGSIAHNQAFEIICESAKPSAFKVELPDHTEGNVNLTLNLAERVIADEAFAVIPNCP